ncbi:hypothetical protein [Alsobacter sp. R-9]
MRPRLRAAACLLAIALMPAAASATEKLVFHPSLTPEDAAFLTETLGLGSSPTPVADGIGSGWDYAVIDLDNDGVQEVAVRPAAPCSGTRCGVTVFTRMQGRWAAILSTSDRDLNVARRVHRGYRELLSEKGTWRWAGKGYALVN